jgi:hypothetical protein
LAADLDLVTDLGEWKRLKCNRAVRRVESAVSDREWEDALTDVRPEPGEECVAGLDVAWKLDTTALVPLFTRPAFRLLGQAMILTPPRDGSSLHPDEIKGALFRLADDYRLAALVMDMHRAEDLAHWVEDEMGIPVIDHAHGKQKTHVDDYNAFMEGLRNGTLKHVGDPGLTAHVFHAIARQLPGGDYRFDRPVASRGSVLQQDRRVIDALSAAAMAVEYSTRAAPAVSVYESRFAAAG